VTAVDRSAAGNLHGFPAALTSFVGRARVVDEVAGLLAQDRLVTVTGPGGAGKTRLPGHVGTNIVANSFAARGLPEPERLSDAQVSEMIPAGMRDALVQGGILPEGATGDDRRRFLVQASTDFRDKAPVTAAQAATVILDGVRAGSWRILVGDDARMIDAAVRAKPDAAYDYTELFAGLIPDRGDQPS